MGTCESSSKSSNFTNNFNNSININSTSLAFSSINPNTSPIHMPLLNLSIDEAKQFLINACNISPSILDDQGNAITGWRIGHKCGPPGYLKDFIPPIGWTAIGLKVYNMYDNEDNTWVGTNNSIGEWYIGYHGIQTLNSIQKIYDEGFRRGNKQHYMNTPNINPLTISSYPLCGIGAYFMPDIEEAKKYTSPFSYNGYKYTVVLMCRINPYKVRIADIGNNKEYWIVEADKLGDLNGKKSTNVVRPYRLLICKEVNIHSSYKNKNF